MAGTLESIARELGEVVAPLGDELSTPEGALGLFAEMGLPLPAAVVTAISTAPVRQRIADDASTVAVELPALLAAIAAEDLPAIAVAVGTLAPPAARAFAGLRDLADVARSAFPADLSAFEPEIRNLITELPGRLLGWLIVDYLEDARPVLLRSLAILGIAESTPIPETDTTPALTRRLVHAERLATLLSDPIQLLSDVYGWGAPAAPADVRSLLQRIDDLLDELELFSFFDADIPELRALLLTLRPAAGRPPTALDILLLLDSLTGIDFVLSPDGAATEVRLTGTGSLDLGAGLRLTPPATLTTVASGTVAGEVVLSIARTGTPGAPLLLFGERDGTRLTATALRASAGARFVAGSGGATAGVVVDLHAEHGQLVVSLGGADGFLSSVLPGTAELDLDLGVRWSEADGLTFRGGAALALTIPVGLSVGPVRLDRLDVAVRPTPGTTPTIALEGRIAGGISLGAFSASVEGLGAGADLLFRGGSGAGSAAPAAIDFGPAALAFRFLPPTGLGLGIDAGPVSGGGFIRFDEPVGRYSGALELKLGVFGVDAVGLLDTRLPGGGSGYALLVVLRASFPPVQLGFGFALSAVGGLLALNRQLDVDALRARMAAGTIGRILAPEDPVRNAPVLINDLAAVFPPSPGITIVGPTLQLSWAELVRFDIGIFVELPGPRKIVLLGSARAAIDNPAGGRPYLQIRLDILGVLDFAAQTLSFDAVLIDSHLLEILELTGGAAFRLSWGAEPYVVLTVGGFHPSYSPAPLVFPASLTRIAMVRGSPTDELYLRFEGYFAVTTNTLQFGASVEAVIRLGDFNIRGFLGFDALIRFEPFHFQFSIAASVKVRYKSHNLGGLDLRGELSGPGPVVFHGKVCFEILWFDICFEHTFTLGSSSPPAVTPVASAVAELASELDDPANVQTSGDIDPRVTVTPATDAALPVVSPLSQAAWHQERAPLDLLLQRFEGAPLAHPETVVATGPQVTGPDIDWFAPGSFAELSDSDALNRRAFERLHAGVYLGAAGTDDGPTATLTVTVKQIRIPAPPIDVVGVTLPAWLLRAVAGRTGAVERDPAVPSLAVRGETWVVRGGDGSVVATDLSQAQAHQLSTLTSLGSAIAATDTVAAMAF
ncbi:MAG TPA: DUF6603 domain-containing protein [Frankiaceae bacterium]|nr:DUF6603 domain-containing protein [Frankiaceae bacterium]